MAVDETLQQLHTLDDTKTNWRDSWRTEYLGSDVVGLYYPPVQPVP